MHNTQDFQEPEAPDAAPETVPDETEDFDAVPTLRHVVQQNLHTITQLRLRARRERGIQDRLADGVTELAGSMRFVYAHVLWFGGWIGLNSGHLGLAPFDPFPYGLLTMVVSLEAIFLATFVMISQNRQCAEADRRIDLHLHIGLLTEHQVTRALKMLDAIQDKLGIENDLDVELHDLEIDTRPEHVLSEIVRLQRQSGTA